MSQWGGMLLIGLFVGAGAFAQAPDVEMGASATADVPASSVPSETAMPSAGIEAPGVQLGRDILKYLESVRSETAQALNLNDCLVLALDRNKSVLEAWHRLQATDIGDRLITRSRFFPQLDFLVRARYERSDAEQVDINMPRIELPSGQFRFDFQQKTDLEDTQALIRFSQRILEFGKESPLEVQFRSAHRAALYDFENAVRLVLRNVREAFQIVVLRDEQMQKRQALLDGFIGDYEISLGRVREETILERDTEFQRLESEITVLLEAERLNNLIRQQEQRKYDLLQLIGEPMDRAYRFIGQIDIRVVPLDSGIRIALANSPEIARQEEELREQARVLGEIKWEYFPDISFDVAYESRDERAGLQLVNENDTWALDAFADHFFSPGDSRRRGGKTNDLERVPEGFLGDNGSRTGVRNQVSNSGGTAAFRDPDDNDFAANIAVSVPLFEGFRRVGAFRRERELLRQQYATLARLREEVEENVRTSYSRVLQRFQQVKFLERQAQARNLELEIQLQMRELAIPGKEVSDQQIDSFRARFFNAQDSYFSGQETLIRDQENLRAAMGIFEVEASEIGIEGLEELPLLEEIVQYAGNQ